MTVEVALVGAGPIARIHLDAWVRVGAEVRVYADDDRAAALAGEFGARATGSLAEALDGAGLADICTPTGTHLPIALAAVAAGAGVVCEKPLAATTAEAEAIVKAAEQAGVPLYPAHGTRYLAPYARLHELVVAGALGSPSAGRFGVTAYHPTAWTGHAGAGSGGILTDQMLHGLDIASWILGDVVRLYACYRGHVTSPAPAGAVAAGTAVLTHAGGAISQVTCGWAAPPIPVHRMFHVVGTAGSASYDSALPQELQVTAGAAAGVPRHVGESPFVAEIREFAAAFAGGPPPRVTAQDGVTAVRLAEAAARSARTGQPVELREPADVR
ncbi:Gfo/Idh/MocA family protein [Actinoplanes sp. N902-109]|uniref:Gfo/Idh/MocA family protein n=1 Tax=Actinoplanes sp. (strain N902-109) TaxID=649831 RepID=UPI0003295A3F|nr:Gfo/Idh/MocA family oxidoreductase [Actinoplanes sp. N902-109]AGL19208.1 NADH-dependent dihydrogenase [Actinoplanes sp. N902-109]